MFRSPRTAASKLSRTGCGAQQAVDATIVSPVTRAGDAQPGADVHPGRAVDAAARRKRHQTYPELVRARRCRLVVVGVEVGGRFGAEAANWLRLLAGQRASDVQAAMRAAARAAWVARWSGLLAVAAQRSGDDMEPDSNRLCAATNASCCAGEYIAGAKASPCSLPSLCCPQASLQKYLEVRPGLERPQVVSHRRSWSRLKRSWRRHRVRCHAPCHQR